MQQNAGFCITNIFPEGRDSRAPVAEGDAPATPTTVRLRPKLVLLRFF